MRDYTQYSVADLRRYISAENFGLILDDTNAKYNTAIWRKYADWGTPSDDKEWIQGQKETPIMVRASLLGTHSGKPQRNGEGWKYYGGSIMKMGHGFSIDEDDLFMIRKNKNLMGVPYPILMADTVSDKTNVMIGGVHAELNYVTLQALSTGQIKEFSIDGTSFDFKFPIADSHFIKAESGKEWFTKNTGTGAIEVNTKADPIKDLLDAQKYLTKDLNLSVDHWKISQELFDRMLLHKSVVDACVARANYFDKANVHLTPQEVLNFMHDMGVWAFDVVDYKSRHEEDGIGVPDAPAFDEHNLVACSSMIMPFEMKCTNSIYIDRQRMGQVAQNHNYFLVEDRIMVLSSTEERPFKNVVDCELYAAPVFNNIREIGFFTAWKEA
ncbi:major capsid protein [Prevotella corporis]|uniref:major capsid protein n=1 Tax=Prevotella corporis TaxID=28128 RepID=UPI0023F565FE|nr:major capsid protein [Prevotella corporis]